MPKLYSAEHRLTVRLMNMGNIDNLFVISPWTIVCSEPLLTNPSFTFDDY